MKLHSLLPVLLCIGTSALPTEAQVFSLPKNISNNTGDSVSPRIAVDSSGNINVVWEDDTSGISNIFFSRSSDGGAIFSAPKNLSSTLAISTAEQIAVDSSGNINLVWEGVAINKE